MQAPALAEVQAVCEAPERVQDSARGANAMKGSSRIFLRVHR